LLELPLLFAFSKAVDTISVDFLLTISNISFDFSSTFLIITVDRSDEGGVGPNPPEE